MPIINLRLITLFALLATPCSLEAGAKRLPVLNRAISNMSTITVAPIQIDLDEAFGTEAIDDQVVRKTWRLNAESEPLILDFALFSNRTPATRTNFLKYVTDGDYANSFIHRSVPGFVIQGGGFINNAGSVQSVPADPPVVNEFGVSNTLGTISMAKSGGNPNSATSQWFVSLGANSDNLDNQNGGFTVFGRVTKDTFLNAQKFGNSTEFPIWNAGSPFDALPLHKEFTNQPSQSIFDYLIAFEDVSLVPLPPGQAGESATLTYSVTTNSNPALVVTSVVAGNLSITPQPGQTGSSSLTIRAIDSVGNRVDDTFVVTVGTADTYTTWASRTVFPSNQNLSTQDPEGDALTNLQEYAFFGEPSSSSQTAAPKLGTMETSSESRFMTLSFPVRKFTTGLIYTVEANDGLAGAWTPIWVSSAGFANSSVVSATDQIDRTLVTIKDSAAIGANETRFLRVKVVQN